MAAYPWNGRIFRGEDNEARIKAGMKRSDKMSREIIDKLCARFGFEPELFRDMRLKATEKGKVFALAAHSESPNIRIVTAGFGFARLPDKPTTAMLQLFGKHATRNVVNVDKENARMYCAGQDLQLKETPENVTDGYVIVSYQGEPLGCGLLRTTGLKIEIKNMLPKGRRMNVEWL